MAYKIVSFISNEESAENLACAKRILSAAGCRSAMQFAFEDIHLRDVKSADNPNFKATQSAAKSADAALFCVKPHSPEQYALNNLFNSMGFYAHARANISYGAENLDVITVTDIRSALTSQGGFRNNDTFGREAYDNESYSELEIERVARVAYELAQTRRRNITLIDCADMLATSQLWRKIVSDINEDYPFVQVDYRLADEAVTELALDPSRFDVVLTSSLMGEFVNPLLACAAGKPHVSLSAALGDTAQGAYGVLSGALNNCGLYIALSAAMMLRHSFNRDDAAKIIESAAATIDARKLTVAEFAERLIKEIDC